MELTVSGAIVAAGCACVALRCACLACARRQRASLRDADEGGTPTLAWRVFRRHEYTRLPTIG